MGSAQEGGLSCSPGMGHPKAWTVYKICLTSPASTGYFPLQEFLCAIGGAAGSCCVFLVACY